MKQLLKKEFSLCMHPTQFIFLAFSVFVFIPNYPYEVMFFFAGLAIFFVSLTARENGDTAFSCTLPVKKADVVWARIIFTTIFQIALLCLAGITTAVKENVFPAEIQVNMASVTANIAFLGYGAVLLGVFNLVFYPYHYKNPERVGIPFFAASAVVFFLIGLLIVFRWTLPLFSEILGSPDPAHIGAKLAVLFAGLAVLFGSTLFSAKLSVRNFEKVDL